MAVLAGGTAVGQAITVISAPVLTRLYGPTAFGTLAVYTSMITLVGGLAALSYHRAIPLPESEGEAASLLCVSVLSTAVLTAATAVALAIAGPELAALLGSSELVPWLWMVPLGIMGLGLYEVLTQWAVRRKSFSTVATTRIARGVGQTATQIGLGVAGAGPVGLLVGQLLGQWTGSGSLGRLAWKQAGEQIRSVRWAAMRRAAVRYRRFPQYTAPAMLLNTVSTQAPPLLLSYYFGGVVTGLYALGARILMMPVTLIAKSASQVFVSSAAEEMRQGRLGESTERVFTRMIRLGAPFAMLLGVAAPSLFAVAFGARWREAGEYTRWLAPWLLTVFLAFPLMPLVSVLERQRAGMIFQAVLLVGRLAGLLAGGAAGDARLAIALFGVGSAVCWVAYLGWLVRIGGASAGGSLR
ncbi:MAG TPA: oligosaccharide flippase family protein, partial [Kofleriaceae bacterium]|nr:oligosaccharide flippase family protein [Kofleriaceae bacterium]